MSKSLELLEDLAWHKQIESCAPRSNEPKKQNQKCYIYDCDNLLLDYVFSDAVFTEQARASQMRIAKAEGRYTLVSRAVTSKSFVAYPVCCALLLSVTCNST